jgi:hypothetical protein
LPNSNYKPMIVPKCHLLNSNYKTHDSTQMPFAKFKLQTHNSTQMPFAKFKLQTQNSTQMPFAKFKLQDVYDSNLLGGKVMCVGLFWKTCIILHIVIWGRCLVARWGKTRINETSAIGTYNKPPTKFQYPLVLV